ncbi:MAG: cytochrome c oxidase subunit II [Candidatus Dormiibacterota bacterium]
MNLLAACQSPFCGSGPVNNSELTVYTAVFWASVALGAFVAGMLVFAFFRFRRKADDEEPIQVHGNSRLELSWTAVPLVVLLGLFILSAVSLIYVNNVSASPNAANQVDDKVLGEQFAWVVTYPDGQQTVGTFYVPVGRPVSLAITSKDVIHSLFIPELMGQKNAVPGQTNTDWLEADQPGIWYGQCTELCGAGHYSMTIKVVALTPTAYNACVNTGKAIDSSSSACQQSGGPGA